MTARSRQCWLDLRAAGQWREAVAEEAVHQRFDAILAADPDHLKALPPTITRVLAPEGPELPADFGGAVLVPGHSGKVP